MEYFYVYLFAKLNTLLVLLTIIMTVTVFLYAISYLVQADSSAFGNDYKEPYIKFRKRVLLFLVPSVIFLTFIPTQKQVAFIITAPMIYNNSDVQETVKGLPKAFNNLLQLGNKYLEETLKDKEITNEK